jgi:hypothetical protein
MSIYEERDAALSLTEEGMRMARLGVALTNDTFLTRAEAQAQQIAMVECWDKELIDSIDKPLFPKAQS